MASTLRALAQKARNRLRAISASNEEPNKTRSEACLSAKVQYAIIAKEKKIQDDPLYNKVKKLLMKEGDTLNPLAYLIEHDIYDELSGAQKEKYMYKLSKRYHSLKEFALKELEEAHAVSI